MLQLERQNYQKNVRKYREERIKLTESIGRSFVVHHVGSTAIPQMSGKNILDILIGAPSSDDLKTALRKLIRKGYFVGKGKEDDYVFLASRAEETRSGDIHIHLAIIGSDRYEDFLYLKNYLLENPYEAAKYRGIKRLIAKTTDGDRTDYKKKKSEYVADLLKKARLYYEKTTKDTSFRETWRKCRE